MLNKAVSSPTWTPSQRFSWRRILSRKETVILLRYVLVVMVLCAVGCLYLWQVNSIKNISDQTIALQSQAGDLEAANTSLMLQLAQWQSPAYIDRRARERGSAPVVDPLRVKLTSAVRTQPIAGTEPGVQRVAETGAVDIQR
jgi:hypothetical protein